MKRKLKKSSPQRKPQRSGRIRKAVRSATINKRSKVKTQERKVMKPNVSMLPIPPHFNAKTVGEVWRVDYNGLAPKAEEWRRKYHLAVAAKDDLKVALLIVDAQNTFCIPDFELYVGGRSGKGAIDDNRRLCEFIYRYLGLITFIAPTMDTHTAMQIFHAIMYVNAKGEHPRPIIDPVNGKTLRDGIWRLNPDVVWSLSEDKSQAGVANMYNALTAHILHYCDILEASGKKFSLTIWPYHAILGGIGHALVSAVDEACFFHNIARASQTRLEIKGGNPLTENYSILRPEVLIGKSGKAIAQKNAKFIRTLLTADRVIIAGQAKSHCVAWTIDDLLTEIKAVDPDLARKVYLLEDCTSPVAVPNPAGGFYADFTDDANAAFDRFAKAGMNIVQSTVPVDQWHGFLN